MKTVLTIATITTILLTGCSEPKEKVEAKTIQYFKAHLDEAKELVQECKMKASISEDERVQCASAERATWSSNGKKTVKGDEKHLKTWKE